MSTSRTRPARTAGPGSTLANRSESVIEIPTVPDPADRCGTRRSPRVRVAQGVNVEIDRQSAQLVDLSREGAQLISPVGLRPRQDIKMLFRDPLATIEVTATVMWAMYEHPAESDTPYYRIGVYFHSADPRQIAMFCSRHLDDKSPMSTYVDIETDPGDI